MRLSHKTKKALRIGAKVGGIGVAVLGGTRLASKEAMKPGVIGSRAVETAPSRPSQPLGVANNPSASLSALNVQASNLLGGAQQFSQFASQASQLSEQSGQFNRRYRG